MNTLKAAKPAQRACESTINRGLVLAVMLCIDAIAFAQQAPLPSSPEIVVSGDAQILVPATKASFTIGILTSDVSASSASAQNAKLSKLVKAALQGVHLKPTDIAETRLNAGKRWDYDEKNRRLKDAVYDATDDIRIETEDLTQLGAYIDAALSAGATNISDIKFFAKNTDAARREALSQAVAAARVDAEAMARAGGGTVGELLLLSTERLNESPGVRFEEVVLTGSRRTPEQVQTDVVPSQIKVDAKVVARWKFVPASTNK